MQCHINSTEKTLQKIYKNRFDKIFIVDIL